MPSQIGGMPAIIANSPPTVSSVNSTTNTTPIVLTAFSHGLNTGDYFYVVGADDPNANGQFMAGTVTTDTVVLLLRPGGNNTVGTLAGGSNGTLVPQTYGTTFQIPSGGDKPNAASINVSLEAIADRTSYTQASKSDGREVTQPANPIVILDWSLGASWVIGALHANLTFQHAFPQPGWTYSVYLIQDGVGGYSVTWPADFNFGSAFTGVAAAGASNSSLWLFRWILPIGATTGSMLCVSENYF